MATSKQQTWVVVIATRPATASEAPKYLDVYATADSVTDASYLASGYDSANRRDQMTVLMTWAEARDLGLVFGMDRYELDAAVAAAKASGAK